MVIEELDARGDSGVASLCRGTPRSTCHHLLAWRQVARQAYRLRAPFLVARESAGTPIRGALPLFVVPGPIESHLRGSGSLAFEAGWGARIAPLRHWIRSATGKAPRLSSDEPLVGFGVRQRRRLPRALADVVGR